MSEHHADTGVLEAHGQDAFVDLVELHKLQEVNEERQAVVYGEVLPASVFTLQRGEDGGSESQNLLANRALFLQTDATHRDHQVVFDLELVTQRQDKALSVLLALTDQEHAATQTRVIAMDTDGQFSSGTTSETTVRLLTGTTNAGVTDPSTRPCFSISL